MHGRYVLLPLLALLASGCLKRATQVSTTGSSADMSSAFVRWKGNFQPQQQATGGVGPTSKNRAFGTAELIPSKADPNRARVQIQLNAPVQAGQSMAWGVYPGRCGSGSGMGLPLVATQTLPMLEVIRNGGAQLDQEIAMTLPKNGSYHLNVFWSNRTSDLADVLTCANLRPEAM